MQTLLGALCSSVSLVCRWSKSVCSGAAGAGESMWMRTTVLRRYTVGLMNGSGRSDLGSFFLWFRNVFPGMFFFALASSTPSPISVMLISYANPSLRPPSLPPPSLPPSTHLGSPSVIQHELKGQAAESSEGYSQRLNGWDASGMMDRPTLSKNTSA